MLAQDTIIKNGMVRTKDSIMECPHCKSTFQKDHVRTRMRKWGKDSFYSTRHCPNCDKRILLRDDNPDIESVNTRLSKLRTYCNYCKMNGQFDEYRDVMSEILELQKQIEDMRNGEMNTKVKDFKTLGGTVYISKGGDFRVKERDNGRGGFEYNVENTVGDGYGGPFGSLSYAKEYCDKMDVKYSSKDSKKHMKDAASVALKKLGQVKKQVKDAFGMNIEEKQKEFDVRNIEKETVENNAFRKVIFTGNTLQLVLMSLLPNEDIGMEVHDKVDQFFRVEEGEGLLEVKDQGTYPLKAGSSMLIKAGTAHNVINNGSEPLKIYTLYGPPNHPADRLQNTKAEAVKEEEKNKVFGGDKKTKDINYKSKLMELKGRLLEQKKGGASTIEIRNTLEEIKEVESIIRNNPSFDSKKTKDKISVYKYKGFTYEYDNENSNKVSFIKTPSGKVIKEYAPNAMPTITGVNRKIDAYIKQVAHDKKTKDASPADKIKDLLQNGYSLKDAILKTEKSIGRQLNAFEAAEAVAVSKKMGKTKDEEEGLYYYKQWQVYGKDGKWTATRRFLGKTGSPGRGEVKITAKSFEEAKSKIDDYIRQVGHDKKTKDIMAVGTIKEIDYKGYQIQLRRYENSVGWKILKDGSLISNGQDFYSESRAVEEAKKDIDALTKDKKMRS